MATMVWGSDDKPDELVKKELSDSESDSGLTGPRRRWLAGDSDEKMPVLAEGAEEPPTKDAGLRACASSPGTKEPAQWVHQPDEQEKKRKAASARAWKLARRDGRASSPDTSPERHRPAREYHGSARKGPRVLARRSVAGKRPPVPLLHRRARPDLTGERHRMTKPQDPPMAMQPIGAKTAVVVYEGATGIRAVGRGAIVGARPPPRPPSPIVYYGAYNHKRRSTAVVGARPKPRATSIERKTQETLPECFKDKAPPWR